MHELKGIFGAAYACSNPSITYCDDWYVNNYKSVFDNENNKKSLQHFKKIGLNHVRTYYLRPGADHSDFLNLCDRLNLSLEIGISNNLLDSKDSASIIKLVNDTKNHKCVKLYTVGNEYFGNAYNIIWGIELVNSMCNQYIMHSSIFNEHFNAAKEIYTKLSSNIKSKYIVGINMYFYGNNSSEQGNVIQNVLNDYYHDPILSNSFLCISEYGRNDDNYDAMWNFLWGHYESMKRYPNYLGVSLFSFTNESWKGNTQGENNYGLLHENGEPKNLYNAIVNFTNTTQCKEISCLKI